MASISSGALCIVKTPYSTHASTNEHWLSLQARDAVKECLDPESKAVISENCLMGSEHNLIEVDQASAVNLKRQGSYLPNRTTVTSVVTEKISLTFEGDLLNNLSLAKLKPSIHPSLSMSLLKSSLTVTGYWQYVQEARDIIHRKLLDVSDSKGNDFLSMEGPNDIKLLEGSANDHIIPVDVHIIPVHDRTIPVDDPIIPMDDRIIPMNDPIIPVYDRTISDDYRTDQSNFSHYDMINEIAPEIVALMKHNRVGFQNGVEYNEQTKTVHFTFSSQDALDKAMKRFEDAYSKLEKSNVVRRAICIPRGIHQEDVGIVISEVESSFDNTVVNWVPQNLEMIVISTAADAAVAKLKSSMAVLNQKGKDNERRVSPQRAEPGIGEKIINYFTTPTPKPVPVVSVNYQPYVKLSFKNGKTLVLRHGDLLEEIVDAIVNPANKHLSNGAGLAKQINDMSGGIINANCRQVLSRARGYIHTGTSVMTNAGGNLKCHFVIHAVGPNAHEIKSETECVRLLKSAIMHVLENAYKVKIKSLAVPAISSGVFGMDKELVAETIIDTLVEHQQKSTNMILNDIRIVIWDKETYLPFLNYFTPIQASLNTF
jgi:O-acetyl-ADP-ribose deacetylase (regulator of RNase III)